MRSTLHVLASSLTLLQHQQAPAEETSSSPGKILVPNYSSYLPQPGICAAQMECAGLVRTPINYC